jgi:hypothetical protein
MKIRKMKGNGRISEEMNALMGRLYEVQDSWGIDSPAAKRIEENIARQAREDEEAGYLGDVAELVKQNRYNDAIHILRMRKLADSKNERDYCAKIALVLERQFLQMMEKGELVHWIRNTWKGMRRYSSRARAEIDPEVVNIYKKFCNLYRSKTGWIMTVEQYEKERERLKEAIREYGAHMRPNKY